MTINYTTLLGLAKPVTGTETGQWGDVVNNEITSLLEDAVANAATFSVTSGNVTLSTTNGTSNQARMSTLIITGTPGTTRSVIAPSQSKIYVVINQSDSSVVIKGAATTGITVASGQTAQVAWNGSDFVEVGNYVNGNFVVNGNLTVNGTSTLKGAVAVGVAGITRSPVSFYPSNASTWFHMRNNNGGGLEFSNGSTPGDGVSFVLGAAGNTSTISTNLAFNADNTYDIGGNGANRPRSLFVGSSINGPYGNFSNGVRVANAFDTGSADNIWWEIGTWAPSNFSNEIELTVYGGVSFTDGLPIANKTIILIRVTNSGAWNAAWRSEGIQGSSGVVAVATNASTGKVYVKLRTFFQKQLGVVAADTDTWTTGWVSTSSTSQPASSTLASAVWQFANGLIAFDYNNQAVSIGTNTINTSRKLYVYGGDTLIERANANVAVGVYSNGGSGRAYFMVSTTQGNWILYDDAASAGRMTLDPSGNVSFGVGNPDTALNLRGTGAFRITNTSNSKYVDLYMDTGTGFAGYATGGAYSHRFLINGQTRVTFNEKSGSNSDNYFYGYDSNARVFIASGTNNYQSSLTLTANNAVGSSYNYIASFTNGDSVEQWYIGGAGYNNQLWFNVSGTNAIRIDSSQRTGFGNVSPASYSVNGSVPRVAIAGNLQVTGATQTYLLQIGFGTQDSGGNATFYVKLGRWNTANNGYICHIRAYYHVGFNANNGQNGIADIFFKTANGASYQAGSSGNFYGDGQFFRLGPTGLQGVRVIQIDQNTYDIYMIIGNYSFGSFYTVDVTGGTSWTESGAGSATPPSGNYIDLTSNVITYT